MIQLHIIFYTLHSIEFFKEANLVTTNLHDNNFSHANLNYLKNHHQCFENLLLVKYFHDFLIFQGFTFMGELQKNEHEDGLSYNFNCYFNALLIFARYFFDWANTSAYIASYMHQ